MELVLFNRNQLIWVVAITCAMVSSGYSESGLDKGTSHRWEKFADAGNLSSGFTRLSGDSTGLFFENSLDATKSLLNQVYLNGSGVALGDVDGDGLCDIYLCGLDSSNQLYLNQGNWDFREVAKKYGVDCPDSDSNGACLVDLDGDGDLDLIVNSVHGVTRLYRNDGTGFSRATGQAFDSIVPGGTSIAVADVNGDNLLDIYISHYRDKTLMDMPNTHFKFKNVGKKKIISSVNDIPVKGSAFENRFRVNSRGGIEENGLPDFLYINKGNFSFERCEINGERFRDSIGNPLDGSLFEWGLAAMFRDINRDGRPDLFVCNDFDSEDRLWLNIGNGNFRLAPTYSMRKSSMFSMGIDFADLNRDGLDDFFILDMLNRNREIRMNQMLPRVRYNPIPGEYLNRPQYMRNTMFLNQGEGVYSEVANLMGVAASDWSWCPLFIDVDLDGYEDLLITNGVERNARHLDTILKLKQDRESTDMTNREILLARKIFPSQRTENIAFKNLAGRQFAENGANWGFHANDISHGMAAGDLDGDGDLDVVVNNLNAPVGVYRNNSSRPRLLVRLKGPNNNTQGIGARVEVKHGKFVQSQEVIAGGRYLSSDDPARMFSMVNGAAQLTVTWPDLKVSVIDNIEPNRLYIVDYRGAKQSPPDKSRTKPIFAATRVGGARAHKESLAKDDQPLLPWALGQAGPGVAWGDFDRDGWEDMAIADGRSGSVSLIKNKDGSGWAALQSKLKTQNPRDGMGVLISQGTVIQSFSNQEDGLAFGDMITLGQVRDGTQQKLAAKAGSAGHIGKADIDADGDLDLFVAGRSLPGKYADKADSWIYLNENGKFTQSETWSSAFMALGATSAAVFAPVDSDHKPDLILACEWGAPKIFINNGTGFVEQSNQYGVDKFTGLWRGIDVGDFNNDGLIDFVATNRGLNSSYFATAEQPLVVYHGDFNQDGVWDFIETEYGENGQLYAKRHLSAMATAMPWITERLQNYGQYSKTPLFDLFAPTFEKQMKRVEIRTLESIVFIQNGGKFEPKALPIKAQFSSAFCPVVADFNNDGCEDIFISQNEFSLHPEESREDAGLGLLMLGDGEGSFRALSISESGVVVPGEGRGSAAADFDHDGRTDLLVAQNGSTPRLFKNQTMRIGLRVILQGDEQNPEGVGAAMRLKIGDGLGAKRIVRLGSGYLSQNAPTQVLGNNEQATGLIVAWPSDGKTEFFNLQSGQLEIVAIKGRGSAWPSASQ